MKSGLKNLPPVIQELVDHIGLPSTIELINQFGGTTINIPMGGTSVGTAALVRLAAVIGEEAAEKLSKICFGEPIYIPKCEKYLRDTRNQNINQAFIEQVRHGKKANSVVAELAREYRLSDRWVWAILKKTISQAEGASETLNLLINSTATKSYAPAQQECMQ